MFVKRAFNKIGQLVTGEEETKKPEEDPKKDPKAKPVTKPEISDPNAGKDSNKFATTTRDSARTTAPVKRELVTDDRYEKSATPTQPTQPPKITNQQATKQSPATSKQAPAQPDFFNDLLDQRVEELKDDADPPFFLTVGDATSRKSINPKMMVNDNYQDSFFGSDNLNQKKIGTLVDQQDLRQAIQFDKGYLKSFESSEVRKISINENEAKITSTSEKPKSAAPAQTAPQTQYSKVATTPQLQQPKPIIQPEKSTGLQSDNKTPPQYQNQYSSQATPQKTNLNAQLTESQKVLPNNRQSTRITTEPTPHLDMSAIQNLKVEEATAYQHAHEEMKKEQARPTENMNPALLRIQERKRATILNSKLRPEIDDLSVQSTEHHTKRPPSQKLGTDVIPMNTQKKELSSSFASDTQIQAPQSLNQQVVTQDLVKAANQQSPDDDRFIDYSTLRTETARLDTQRRTALKKSTSTLGGVTRLQQQKQEDMDRNSSESYLTDKSFDDNCSVNSDDVQKTLQQHEDDQQKAIEAQKLFFDDLKLSQQVTVEVKKVEAKIYFDEHKEEEDYLHLVSENEHLFITYAEKKLNSQRNLSMQTANSLQKYKECAALQKVIADPILLKSIGSDFNPNVRETCVAIQEDYILIGTSAGLLYVYNKDAQIKIGIHKEDGKEFVDNAITSIDIHPTRRKYAVLGFAKGQMALIDLSNIAKTLKLVKDVHKKPVVSVKFCDWIKERPHFAMGPEHKCNECVDPKDWMFVSVDTDGKVVLNTVVHKAFGILYADDSVLNDPIKNQDHVPFQTLAPRFHSSKYPLEAQNDNITMIAMASFEGIVIRVVGEKSQEEVFTIDRPKRYPSENMNDVVPITSQLPCLAWGFGKTPRYNFQNFPILAIAWGPLIQLVVFKDINGERERNEDFHLDGCYVISQGNFTKSHNGLTMDNFIESLCFIDESLLFAITATQEIRVMNTEKFKEDAFIQPEYLQVVDMAKIDSRCKMLPEKTQLTQKQTDVEMERIGMLDHPLLNSLHGQFSSQTQAVHEDRVVCITEGGTYSLHHLGWLESLGSLETTSMSRSWIEIFAKALEIYLGKVKGLRIAGFDEEMRKGSMRDQLKSLIEKQVTQIINQWNLKEKKGNKNVSADQSGIETHSNFSTLIRIVIEFCVEIGEPGFLFDVLLKKFVAEGRSSQFAEEIKPYIICRDFAECVIQSSVLDEHILKHHRLAFQSAYEMAQQQSKNSLHSNPAENFEKILISLRLDKFSQEYMQDLIQFCRIHKLSSGLVYSCQSAFGEQGPLHALVQLRDLFIDTYTEEAENNETQYIKDDLLDLKTMLPSDVDRIELECSSVYLSLKLMWTTRLYLLGKKFPQGHLTNHEWHIAVHDIVDFLTQEETMEQFTEIDAAAYFQILSIVFNNPSNQFSFIEKGRPEQTNKYQPPQVAPIPEEFIDEEQIETLMLLAQPPSLTHEKIVERVSDYFNEQGKTHAARLHFLCFIASISGSYEQHVQTEKDINMYFEVALELLKHNEELVSFNKDLIQRRMTNKQMYRRLSQRGNHAPDNHKHEILSEEMLLMLIEKSQPLFSDNRKLDQLLEAAERTTFDNVKLVLYEINHDYLKCLKLFMKNRADSEKPKLNALSTNGITDGFGWVEEKHKKLEEKVKDLKDKASQVQLKNFENEVLSQVLFLARFSTAKTIKLCDAIFKSNHLEVLEKLQGEQKIQLNYINQLVETKKDEIKELVSSFGTSATVKKQIKKSSGNESAIWTAVFNMHVRLLCVLEPLQVTSEIEKIIKENFYPMEDCLKICTEFKQSEASALLYKKIGNYQEAIKLYIQILNNGLDIPRFKKEVFYLEKDQKRQTERERAQLFIENQARLKQRLGNQKDALLQAQTAMKPNVKSIISRDKKADHQRVWVEKFGKNIGLLDKILEKVQNICKFHSEVLESNDECWKMILLTLFKILFHPSLRKKGYCKRHLKLRMVGFCRCILPFVSFNRIVQASMQNSKTLRFKAIKELVHEVFYDKSQEYDMCLNAQTTQCRDLVYLQEQDKFTKSEGITFLVGALTCGLCEKPVNFQAVKSKFHDDIKVFDCGYSSQENHSFHVRCLKQTISEEVANDKSKKAPTLDSEISKLFRCLICYPKNQDILFSDSIQKIQKAKDSENGRSGDAEDSLSDSETSKSSTKSSKSEMKSAVKSTLRRQFTHAEQKQMQMEKHMKMFEEKIMNQECLSLCDFASLR